jgi:hypothetical protein
MAVTIDNMQVDVEKPAPPSVPMPAASGDVPKLRDRYDLHHELKVRAQRDLRLKAD